MTEYGVVVALFSLCFVDKEATMDGGEYHPDYDDRLFAFVEGDEVLKQNEKEEIAGLVIQLFKLWAFKNKKEKEFPEFNRTYLETIVDLKTFLKEFKNDKNN